MGYLYVTDAGRLDEVMGHVGWDRVQPGAGPGLGTAAGLAGGEAEEIEEEATSEHGEDKLVP